MGLDIEKTYKGKKIFITGHTGFKGSWMIQMLKELGAIIKGYSLKPESKNDLYNLIDGDSLCSSTIDDIRNYKRLHKEIIDFQPDFIFHLAAQAQVLKGFEESRKTFEVNVMGTINILEVIKSLTKNCHVIIITTDKVYYNYEREYSYKENDRLGGKDPYSNSKACSELAVNSYRDSFFNNSFAKFKHIITVARAGNVIGGGDWSTNRIIPDFIRSIQNNTSLVIRSPKATRPWQYVLDPIYGYLILGHNSMNDPKSFSFHKEFNLGPKYMDCISVKNLIEKCINYLNKGKITIKEDNIKKKKESTFLNLDTTKIERILGFFPIIDLDKGIKLTMDWYKKYLIHPSEIKDFSKKQCENYLNHRIK
mgnify:CR=1 FL=1